MKNIISITFSILLVLFIGLMYLLFGGSKNILSAGAIAFSLLLFILSIVFSFQVLKNNSIKFGLIYLAYFFSIATIIYGLLIRIQEGMARYQHPVGLKVFFIGVGMLLALLIIQLFYFIVFFKDPQEKLKENR